MTEPAREIFGRDQNGEMITATLSVPVQPAGQPEWVCVVHCPAIFGADKRIAGVDVPQALELAEGFIRALWDERSITAE